VGVPKVLIADDSPVTLRLLESMLTQAGLAVVTARDGLDAIEKAFTEGPSLVILDVMMPRMTGYQACRLLKSEPSTRAIPVVILTSRNQPRDRFWGLETGADYYLTKDSDPKRLGDLVRNILSGEAAPAPVPAAATGSGVDVLARVNELLDRKLYEATVLSEIGKVAHSLVRFDETYASVMRLVAQVVDFTFGGTAFVEGEELELVLTQNRGALPPVLEESRARILEAVTSQHPGVSFRRAQVRMVPLHEGTLTGPMETIFRGLATFPVSPGGRASGLLALSGKAVQALDGDGHALLKKVAQQAHMVLENSRLFERVQNLAIRDSLTGLYNHNHVIELLAQEVERALRYGGAVSVCMADIDHFKQVNDAHGHLAGDAVLREIARLMRDTLRTADAVGRYGGEEFLVILPQSAVEEASQTAERLRRQVEGHVFRAGGKELRVTLSLGVAGYPGPDRPTSEGLIREADRALYRAKESGRNRVAVAGPA
jgi:two-component system cell cycle response regulator